MHNCTHIIRWNYTHTHTNIQTHINTHTNIHTHTNTLTCVAYSNEKVKPMPLIMTLKGMRPALTSQPPQPYSASSDMWMAALLVASNQACRSQL